MSHEMTLVQLNQAQFKTSKHGDGLNEILRTKLGFKAHYDPARLAIARSLSVLEAPLPIPAPHNEDDGRVIKGYQLFGDDLPTWVALVVEHSALPQPTLKDVQELVRRHWHRGLEMLMAEWEATQGDYNRFILQLAERAGVRPGGTTRGRPTSGQTDAPAGPISLQLGEIGQQLPDGEVVRWLMNGQGYAPHVAIMGKAGSGKTRTGLHMIRQVREQTGCPVLLFDMAKGDLANNAELVRSLGATVIRTPRQPIPLDVLHVPERNVDEANRAALRFRDSFRAVSQSRLGALQLDSLRDAVRDTLLGKLPARIVDVRDQLKRIYADKKRKEDGVVSTFNDLTVFELFAPQLGPTEFFSRSWIIDLHEANSETERRLVVFLILDALCTYQRGLGEAPTDAANHRAVRLVIGVDEARKVLGAEHASLIDLVRESRSKGLALFFMSQSPDDYEGEEENFLENIGLALSFTTNATRMRALQRFLGETVDLSNLGTGVAATRLPGHQAVRVKCW